MKTKTGSPNPSFRSIPSTRLPLVLAAAFGGIALTAATLWGAVSTPPAVSYDLQVQDRGSQGLSLSLTLPEGIESNSGFDGEVWISDSLAVPAITRWVAVPAGYRAQVQLNRREAVRITADTPRDGDEAAEVSSSELLSRVLTPVAPVVVGKTLVFRGVQIVPVTIFLMQLEENRDAAIENRELDFDLDFVADPSGMQVKPVRDRAGSAGALMVDRMLLNPPSRDPEELQFDHIGHILILHLDDLSNQALDWVDTLATWKRQMGYRVSVEAISRNLIPLQIREFVRGNYFNDNPDPISHLILIGANSVEAAVFFRTEDALGDHYFSLMDDNDEWSSDITVGRFYALSVAELQGEIRRSVLYEREPSDLEDDWFTTGLYTAEFVLADQFVPSMVTLGRWIWSRFIKFGYTPFDTIYARELGGADDRVREIMEGGCGIALSRGHLAGCLGADTDRRNPFIMAITCLSALTQFEFFRSTQRNDPIGPIASMSMAGFTHTKGNNSILGWATRSIVFDGEHKPGVIQLETKYHLYSDLQYDPIQLSEEVIPTLQAYRLLGDPTVNVFFHHPVSLLAEHPDTLMLGATGLDVTVSSGGELVPDAVVCIYQAEGVHLAASPGADGCARFTLGNDELQAGTLTLTVSKPDAVPYLAEIPVVADGMRIELAGLSFDDQDGYFANGETIPSTLTFHNASDVGIDAVSLKLTTEDDFVVFDPDSIMIGDIAADGDADANFDLFISRSSLAGRTVRVDAEVTAGEQIWSHAFDFNTSGPFLRIQRYADGDGALDRGSSGRITPVILNSGDLASPVVDAVLVSLDTAWVRVTREAASYRGLNQDASSAPSDNGYFEVEVDSLAIPGNTVEFKLLLSAQDENDGFRDTVSFMKTLGAAMVTDPLGPDGYGYMCFDSYDEGWGKAPDYSWIEINPNVEGYDYQGTQIPIADVAQDKDSSVVVALPFSFKYYGQEFDTIVVCSNGWIAFGSEQSMFLNFRNWTLPGIEGPDAQVCVFWDDLFNPRPDFQGIYQYYAEDLGAFIIEWSGMAIFLGPNASADSTVDVQVLLLNPEHYPTSTGDGDIKMQYRDLHIIDGDRTDVAYSTVGIKNLDNTDGLQYTYWNNYPDQCRPLENGLALLFTIDADPGMGELRGRAVDAGNREQGLAGVSVRALKAPVNSLTVTDVNGYFTIDSLQSGLDYLEFSFYGFNTNRVQATVPRGEVGQVGEVLMTHPEVAVSADSVSLDVQPGHGADTLFYIQNHGNGPLDFTLTRRYPDGSDTRLNQVNKIGISSLVGDQRIYGSQFVGDEIFVAGTRKNDNSDDNTIYVIDQQGQEVRRFAQPTYGTFGFHDLAWDGEHLYGGEDSLIIEFDTAGNRIRDIRLQISDLQLSGPFALEWNPADSTLLAANQSNRIFEFDLQGNLVRQIEVSLPNETANIFGLAWNPADNDGMPLYVMDVAPQLEQRRMRLVKVDPATGDGMAVSELVRGGGRGLGLSVGFGWNESQACLASIEENGDYDTLRIYEIGPNTGFVTRLTPRIGEVGAGAQKQVYMIFESAGYDTGTYSFALRLEHNAAGEAITIPIAFKVDTSSGVEGKEVTPTAFRLEQAYPNPFNAFTMLRFSLDRDGWTSLTIYDLSGREVTSLVDRELQAGEHRINFEGAGLASGIYFCKLKQESKIAIQRMVLLR